MKNIFLHLMLALTMAGAMCSSLHAQSPARLERQNGIMRLVKDGRPMLMLGGELHNSTSSSPETMRRAMETAKAMHVNSIIASVSWERLEPEEGVYDFTEVDDVISIVKEYQMPVTLIWFASYKNGESSYAPIWVKSDTGRFYRCRAADGSNTTTISPMCQAAIEADSRAYTKLMEHIRDNDTDRLICVMQVENEMGAFIDIDHTPSTMEAFESQVPKELMQYIRKNEKTLCKILRQQWENAGKRSRGTWKEVFGDNEMTKQFFMSWAFARFAQQVAAAGKKVYDIPMYVNCWWADENAKTGSYPNGGPRNMMLDIYKAAAPDIDFLAPDCYHTNACYQMESFTRADNPLFVPEIRAHAGLAYRAFGEYNAICFSPFGIEEHYNEPYLVGEYQVLSELLPEIGKAQGTGLMHGFVRQPGVDEENKTVDFTFGDYIFHVHYIDGEANTHGLIIKTGEDEFLVAGVGAYIDFSVKDKSRVCKVGWAEEIERKDGEWKRVFVLNGDETGHHNMLYLRGRTPLEDMNEHGMYVPAPIYAPSYQRMHKAEYLEMFKVSGIYRIKLYTYPEK